MVSDINPLSGLHQLELLNLGNNKISSIDGLRTLNGSLKGLDVDSNNVSDVGILSEFKELKELWLSGNKIKDIGILRELHYLRVLNVSDNMISESGIESLSGLHQLETLDLSGNNIPISIEGLRTLNASLIELWLGGCNISSIEVLGELKKLRELYLPRNKIKDIEPLRELHNLELLDLSANMISDIDALSGLTGLEKLYLSQNNISDINPLRNIDWIGTLHLDQNNIEVLDAFTSLGVCRLYLSKNKITDIKPLSENAKHDIYELDLSYNSISDVEPLSKLDPKPSHWGREVPMRCLFLRNNRISNCKPLAKLRLLEEIDLR
eukprot:177177_1